MKNCLLPLSVSASHDSPFHICHDSNLYVKVSEVLQKQFSICSKEANSHPERYEAFVIMFTVYTHAT